MWKVMGMVIAVLVFMYLRVRHPELPLLEALLLAVPPAAAIWLANRLQLLMARMKVRDDLIQEQLHSVEARHEELRQVYLEQEHTTVRLKEAYRQIEELNVGLEAKVRERTAALEAANERLKEMDRLKSQFLAHVSHELRTPLTSIKGFVENLLERLSGPLTDKQEKDLTRVKDNTNRLARMIGDLLDRSRIDAGKLELSLGEVALTNIAADVVEQLQPLAVGKQQRLQFTCAETDVIVLADEDRLSQIFTQPDRQCH
jgi:signal transduction histidine kinase